MNQEDKELLLKDLCVRLPYKTYVKTTKGIGYVYAINTSQLIELSVANDSEYWSEVFNIGTVKPYLRPMSSMTEEERTEYFNIIKNSIDFYNCPKSENICFLIIPIDWLLKHHFDCRGLIEKGLAIEAPEGIYNLV